MFLEVFLKDQAGRIIARRAKDNASFQTNVLICFLKGMERQDTKEQIEDAYSEASRIQVVMTIVE